MVHIASTWRRMKYRYNLYGNRCENCGIVDFPPRIICPKCRRAGKIKEIRLSDIGKVHSFTQVHVASEGYELQTPYVLAIIQLPEGPMLTAQIVECDIADVKIGMPVEMVFRKIVEDEDCGLIHYGFKFRPLLVNAKR